MEILRRVADPPRFVEEVQVLLTGELYEVTKLGHEWDIATPIGSGRYEVTVSRLLFLPLAFSGREEPSAPSINYNTM